MITELQNSEDVSVTVTLDIVFKDDSFFDKIIYICSIFYFIINNTYVILLLQILMMSLLI